jgi:Rieske Fe-S protein
MESEGPIEDPVDPDRRTFLASASTLTMAGGLVAAYGTFGAYAGRFLYPAKPPTRSWVYVIDLASMKVGGSLRYRTPIGAAVTIARQGETGEADDFVALSSVCPHLGCHVHWEPHNERFFCPCHNGVFDKAGNAVSGPPADAKQSLSEYQLKVDNGLLYIKVQTESITASVSDRAGDVQA